jgi:hypothetical protein
MVASRGVWERVPNKKLGQFQIVPPSRGAHFIDRSAASGKEEEGGEEEEEEEGGQNDKKWTNSRHVAQHHNTLCTPGQRFFLWCCSGIHPTNHTAQLVPNQCNAPGCASNSRRKMRKCVKESVVSIGPQPNSMKPPFPCMRTKQRRTPRPPGEEVNVPVRVPFTRSFLIRKVRSNKSLGRVRVTWKRRERDP